MSKTDPARQNLSLPFTFGSNFLKDHAGHIISDPRVAITELIANAYDAGATSVEITWPGESTGQFRISDNGIGMSLDEFNRRWRTLSYDRSQEQGDAVEFPPGVTRRNRTAFGRNGKGRHAAFCFADSYELCTKKDGASLRAEVRLTEGGTTPFDVRIVEQSNSKRHGTIISAIADHGLLAEDYIRDVIGGRFLVDPSFSIFVNGKPVQLVDVRTLSTASVTLEPWGTVEIRWLDAPAQDRSAKLKGLTWWVNDRMVGEPSWDGLDGEGNILDGRTTVAKRFSFIIRADVLAKEVKPDWTGFHATQRSTEVRTAVRRFVAKTLHEALADDRKSRKRSTLQEHRHLLSELPDHSKQVVAQFVEQVQESCPRLSEQDLSRTVEIYAKLEQTRSGYDLLKQLATCSPDDLDTWNAVMGRWTASSAELVLNELGDRLNLLAKLQLLINDRHTDEVHDLQPLFERGLWMFGPEYEAVDFRSNRGMAEVIRRFFGQTAAAVSEKRPDFVALSDTSIGPYSADSYADSGEVIGCRKLLIVELKRGGFELTQKEMDQARDYVREIRAAGCISKQTPAEAYVLGARIEEGLGTDPMVQGATTIQPMVYANLLCRAHARTFHLHQQISQIAQTIIRDPDLAMVLEQNEPLDLFADSTPMQ
jgi:hypothetical protein